MDTLWKSRKVVIVGAGAVGSTFTCALAQKGLAEQIFLIDVNPDIAKGQALDVAETYLGKLSPKEHFNVY